MYNDCKFVVPLVCLHEEIFLKILDAAISESNIGSIYHSSLIFIRSVYILCKQYNTEKRNPHSVN